MNKKTYTAPAVISRTDAVQNTKAIVGPPVDGSSDNPGNLTPGAVGFYL